jgi:DNA protecting protein DprA
MNSETAILQLMQAKGLGTKTLHRVLRMLAQEGRMLEEFISSPVEELTERYGLKPEIAESIQTHREDTEQLAEELARHNIRILIRGEEGYPARLARILDDAAPPVLFAEGNFGIFEQKSVGFCGPRKASDEALCAVDICARMLAENEIHVVGGYAPGVDLAAHHAAMDAGGNSTFVLAEGILNFRKKGDIALLIEENNHVILSEFSPQAPWNIGYAMQRNRTICGMSDAIIMVEPGLTGGTYAAGKAALELRRPLFVLEYSESLRCAEGTRYFLKRGAKPLPYDAQGKPHLDEVFHVLEEQAVSNPENPTQECLFDLIDNRFQE